MVRTSNLGNFRLEFERVFKGTILDNESANRERYTRLHTDAGLRSTVLEFYLGCSYQMLRHEPSKD